MYLSGTKVSTASEVIWTADGEVTSLIPGLALDWNTVAMSGEHVDFYHCPDDTVAMRHYDATELPDGAVWIGELNEKFSFEIATYKANFTQVGEVTYSGEVASGFNATSYLTADIPAQASIGSYTFITKVTANTSPKTQAGVGNSENDKSYVRIFSSSTLGIWNGSANQGTFAVTSGTTYWVALHYNGTNTVQYVLADDNYTLDTLPEFTNWTANVTVDSSFMSDVFGNKMYIGRHVNDSTSGEYWGGSIDLENTVLKGKQAFFETPETTWWKPLGGI